MAIYHRREMQLLMLLVCIFECWLLHSELSDGCPDIVNSWLLGIVHLLTKCTHSLHLIAPLPTIPFLSMLQVKMLRILLVCFTVCRLSGQAPSKGFSPISSSLS